MVIGALATQTGNLGSNYKSDIPHGYRSTDLGLIPRDWELKSIGELMEFKNGLNKAKSYFGHGTPIINYMDVFSRPGLYKKNIGGLVEVSRQEREAYGARKGDVFFTRTSETVNEIGIASVLLEDIKDAVFSGFLLRGRPVRDNIVDEFKQYCFSTVFVRNQIVSMSSYTTRALTNGKALSKVRVLFPSTKSEQRAIAEVLFDIDAVITSLELLIEKKRKVKYGAMHDLLSHKRRLPYFDKPLKVEIVADFGHIVTGGTPPTNVKAYWNGDVPWITPTDITLDRDISISERRLTEAGLKLLTPLPSSTLLVTCIASIGKNAILRTRGACNQQINAIIPNDDHDIEYLYYLFEYSANYLLANSGVTATRICPRNR